MTHLDTAAQATTPQQREAAWREHAAALELELGIQRGTVATAREYVDELEAAAAEARDEIAALRRQLQDESEARAELERRIATDPLTGAGSRAWLDDAYDSMEPYGLVFVDVDDFKAINDTFGHDTGDAVLIEVAARLIRTMPGGVARLGGDEFAIVVPQPDTARPDPAAWLSEAAAAALAAVDDEPIQIDAGSLDVTVSVGVAPTGADLAETKRRADVAMYHDKHCAGDCGSHEPGAPVLWVPEMVVPAAQPPARRRVRRCPA